MKTLARNSQSQIMESLFYCGGYLLSYGLILMIIISIALFFQFQLGYEMTAMDSWLFDHGWEMNAFVSVLNLVIVSKFLYLKSDDRYPLRSLLINQIRRPPKKIIVVLFAFLISYSILLELQYNSDLTSIDYPKVITGYLLSSFFLISHFMFIASLQSFLPLGYLMSLLRVALISLGLYFIVYFVFPQAQALSFIHLVLFFLILHTATLEIRISDLIFLSVFCFSPVLILTGFDPLWGDRYSPWIYTGEHERVFFLSIGIICTAYVGYPLLKGRR
jgi:hypothetical protein